MPQWLTAPLRPPPLPRPPPQPTTSRPCPRRPPTRAATPPSRLRRTAAWTATPLWGRWPAADNTCVPFLIETVNFEEPVVVVCRAALLMYSMFLFPLFSSTVNDCLWMCISITVFLLQRMGVRFAVNLWCMFTKQGVWVDSTLFYSHGYRWTVGYLNVNIAIWFEYIFELFIWNFVFLGGFEWIYTSSLDSRR